MTITRPYAPGDQVRSTRPIGRLGLGTVPTGTTGEVIVDRSGLVTVRFGEDGGIGTATTVRSSLEPITDETES